VKNLFIFLFVLFSVLLTNSFGQKLSFDVLSLDQGLSNAEVVDIHQDNFGFIWFATKNGLNRFDGVNFTTYRLDPSDSTSIHGNHVTKIYEDKNSNLWLPLQSGGLSLFIRSKNEFVYFEFLDSKQESSKVTDVECSDNEVLVGTKYGLYKIDQGLLVEKVFDDEQVSLVSKLNELTLVSTTTQCYLKSNNSKTWQKVALPSNIASIYSVPSNGYIGITTNGTMFAATKDLNEVKPVQFAALRQDLKPYITHLTSYNKNQLFAGIWGNGLFIYDNEEQKWNKAIGNHPQNINYSLKDSNEGTWFIADFNKLYYRAKDTDVLQYVPIDINGKKIPEGIVLSSLMVDKTGVLWIGTEGQGIFVLPPKRHAFKKYTQFLGEDSKFQDAFICSIVETSNYELWFGTREGLYSWELSTGKFRIKRNSPYNINGTITALCEDENGNLWVATISGLTKFDKGHKKFEQYYLGNDSSQIKGSSIKGIFKDEDNVVWILTDQAINRFNSISNTFSKFLTSSSVGPFTYLLKWKTNFWVGTENNGVLKVDFKSNDYEKIDLKFSSKTTTRYSVNVLGIDKEGELLAGTKSYGLIHFDNKKNVFTMNELIPKSGSKIVSIELDENKNLWLGSNDGLFKISKQNQLFRFDANDGLQSKDFTRGSSLVLKNGNLVFAGIDGFNVFNTNEIKDKPGSLYTKITSVYLFDKELKFEKPISTLTNLELSYKDNYFTIEFLYPDYTQAKSNEYNYILKGFDNDWNKVRGKRTAGYTNVPPGNYTFMVKNSNNYNENNLATLSISILPPFWETWWFYVLVGLFIIALLLSIHFFRIHLKVEKIKDLESIRQTAAADFHDELGHKLTRISFLSEMAIQKMNGANDEFTDNLKKIKQNSQDLYHTTRDFLWALDSQKDTAYDLGVQLKDFGEDLFQSVKIDFHVSKIDTELKTITLNMNWKRHLLLIFKEAMNNALKHADCANVYFTFEITNKGFLKASLTDDGKGFDLKGEKASGYGLRNMQVRANKLGLDLSITSEEGKKGSTIVIEGEPKA
jgi:ligand-binding sensor domain-containing protein/two-component sensor histidine kinase